MFEKYSGLISLEDYLKNEYGCYDFNIKNLMTNDFISYEGNGNTAKFWIKDKNNESYLFKASDDFTPATVYGELISKKICEVLGIPSAEVRACTFKGKLGILSKKVNREDQTIINGGELIQFCLNNYGRINENNPYKEKESFLTDEAFKELYQIPSNILRIKKERDQIKYVYNNLNNLEQLWSLISLYVDEHGYDKLQRIEIVDYLVKVFLFDLIMMQADRHIENWGVIYENQGIHPCPLYDNASVLGLSYKDLDVRIDKFNDHYKHYKTTHDKKSAELFSNFLYKDRLLLTVSETDITNAKQRKRKNNINVLDGFLKITDKTYIDLFEEYIHKVKSIDFESLIEEIEKGCGITIPHNIKLYIIDNWYCNLEFITAKMKEFGLEVKNASK